jgi:RNA polymerase sigma factor (TIGR02999 family)
MGDEAEGKGTRRHGPPGHGDPPGARELLPLVYDELRRLAAARLAREAPGHTLEATALVHEAYLRLVVGEPDPPWDNRGHFFAAAAEAMRRILVEAARRRGRQKRGGGRARLDLDPASIAASDASDDLLDLDGALARLAAVEPRAAEVLKLRVFAGLTLRQAADALSISPRSADNDWAYARAWLLADLNGGV